MFCSSLTLFVLSIFTGGVPSVPVLLQPEGNVLRWDRLDGNGAEIIQLIISFKRYLHVASHCSYFCVCYM